MTGYVSTRYYRAPEVMLTWQRYGVEMDIWSAGCVIAEMFNGRPLFPGQDPINQFYLILDVLGNPSDKFISRICTANVGIPGQFVVDAAVLTGTFRQWRS